MAELDLVAHLKETREGMAYWTWPRITGEVLDDIIAALEDRDRLRTVATLVYRRYLEGFDPLDARFWSELRAELEGRDG